MASIGHWRDTIGNQLPGTNYTGFSMNTPVRVDAGAGLTRINTSTIQVNSALKPGFAKIFIATIKTTDDSNGRFNMQARFNIVGGSGNMFVTNNSGYSRNNNNRTAWCRAVGILYESTANTQVQLVWRRDTDASTTGSIVNASDIQVFDIAYNNLGHYSDTSGGFPNGGTTPTVLPFNNTITETNPDMISRSGNEVSITGGDRRYLIAWTTAGQTAGNRTQRVGSLRYNGTVDLATRSYVYQRNANNQYAGLGAMDVHEAAVDQTIDVVVYRGDGVLAGQGGADENGSWTVAANATEMIVMELPWNASVFRSHDGTGEQNLATASIVGVNAIRDVDIDVGDSFTRIDNTTVQSTVTTDVFCWANIWTARENVGSGSRWTAGSRFEIGGVDQTTGEHGNYCRGNQASQDTFACSFHPAGTYAISTGDNIRVEIFDAGDNGATDQTQPGTVGFIAIDLDTINPISVVQTNIV